MAEKTPDPWADGPSVTFGATKDEIYVETGEGRVSLPRSRGDRVFLQIRREYVEEIRFDKLEVID